MLYIKLPVLMFWFCIVYCKFLLLHKISLMLFIKTSTFMLWFYSVYCKMLLLYKVSLMLFNKLTTFIPYVRIVYCKMPLLYRNFSHVPVTKNCSLFWLLLHIKLSMLMFWFCSVYRKSLLLHKISLMLFNKLTTFMPCVRIVYCKILLLYNNFSHVSKRTPLYNFWIKPFLRNIDIPRL